MTGLAPALNLRGQAPCGGLAGRPIHLGRADTDGQTRVRIELAGAVPLPMVDRVIVQLGVQHLSIHL